MQGNLQQVPLPEVLQFISMGKSTGFLHLRRDGTEITLSIQSGKIINSSSLDRRRRIGDLLVNRGLLSRSELARLLEVQKKAEKDKPLGQLITERELVTEEAIRETLRLQLEEEIWDLFAWETGDFRFETASAGQLGDALVHIDIEPMILEGTRRNDEWKKIQGLIPHDQVIPVTNLPSDDFERDINLRPAEWEVLSRVNGRFPIRAIVNRSNLGRFEVHMILYQFLQSGLLRLREEGEIPPSAPGAADTNGAAEAAHGGPRRKGGGFFGSLINKGGAKKEKGSGGLQFISPIGAMGWYISELVRRIAAAESARRQAIEAVPAAVWAETVQMYTRADLITVTSGRLNTMLLETYLSNCEFGEVTEECYEDAMEGMATLAVQAIERLNGLAGDKTVSRIGKEILEETRGSVSCRYHADFELTERVQTILNAAAA